ncbi:DUF1538 domain-containing protein [Aerococcus sp. UMB10185]|uniref:DUF1538 domain-containing protein n=1 Tax=unclassified Aerococcus TaxID=2618060 RepID=UPI0008A1AACA|nr:MULTISPECIES: DUF1538 domain-containing protein [unclassified Aerococcus]MDK6232712.1 DUF1538 domain-containing protein [Aerococcus sp. UMB10185]MDK6805339.1 DUF1538 domain-containing protein [Aerococcus sp. UMB7834]MDK6854998.1 DUF1538 domain-containing protein [Aerococcus sp. UMB7533]MDK8501736.1 DUF1538 domain-containing protein [Aerococcus sp. UMB1112A]OFN02755.1 hypothetical protein HMPREF2626_02265 [Aerococcus sp. HMSC062A02]
MDVLIDKFKEVAFSVIPLVVIVLLISMFAVNVPSTMMMSFVIGAVLILVGLTIFLFGIEIGMTPIGNHLGAHVAGSPSRIAIAVLSFIIGFAVTIAEPDLLILGQQIENATSGVLPGTVTVVAVSVGVGVMIAFGVFRLLKNFPLKYFFAIVYALILILAIFSDNSAIAMGFDASGATTGALTTPFILALSGALAAKAGGKQAEENSFGLVGAMSTGPILAVLFLILFSQTDLQAAESTVEYSNSVIAPILAAIWPTLKESLIALVPIVLFFIFMNWRYFKLKGQELGDIFKGIIYTVVGLTIFLVGVNQGFMDMGHFLGQAIAEMGDWWLIIAGFTLGMVVVLAEPAVHVLGEQVEDITGGHIHNKVLMGALSIGVALAVGLSMVRILNSNLAIWHFLLPGFGLAILLSFMVPNLFTGIAFDAGGVASGPMTATFILAFAQGAADFLPNADALDAFGVIAFVAMVPVVMVELLGLVFKIQTKKTGIEE